MTLVDRRSQREDPDPWQLDGKDWSRVESLVRGLGPANWSVDLVLVDDQAMADLNRSWRGGEGVTDVLSFTYLEEAGDGLSDVAAGDEDAARDMWLPPVMAPGAGDADSAPVVGEVVLAPGFVADRCRAQGWDTDLEWPLLVVHGCLHVLGWEHDNIVKRSAMADREAEHLARVGLPHPLRERN
ncbi:rRNA maturation RNase YbeY [bacterium]|nr:MAG: rRNA maturation RNase YbeY [bacterium]